jgi:hypothetical protein
MEFGVWQAGWPAVCMFLMLAGTPVLTALALLLTPIHRESSEWGRMPGIHSQSAILIEGDANEIVPNAKLAAAMHGFVIMGIQVCEHSRTNGSPLSRGARELGIERIGSKFVSSRYVSGCQDPWQKLKYLHEQELVIGGFKVPFGGGPGVGSLLLGSYVAGRLCYSGSCAAGFALEQERVLRHKLNDLVQDRPSLFDFPRACAQSAIWVQPELVARISFASWPREWRVRHAYFKGVCEDKPATEVVANSAIYLVQWREIVLPKGNDRDEVKLSRQIIETSGGLSGSRNVEGRCQ